MDLKDFASISGKSGLFKIVKPTRNGVIVESISEPKKKMVANANNRISVLEEISVYTHTGEGSVPLKDVFKKIYEEFKEDPGVTGNSSPDELKAFIEYIVPDYDKEKVYVSDIKKIISWYHLLIQNYPEIFTSEEESSDENQDQGKAEKKEDQDELNNKKEIEKKENKK